MPDQPSFSVTKRYKFSAAHHLPGYEGLCGRVHGHTYHAEITAEGERGAFGMVVDFTDLSRAWVEVEPRLDHADLNKLIDEPSTENLADWILEQMRWRVPQVTRVRVYEGPDQWVDACG